MKKSASIAQEYYKVQDLWKKISSDENWRLAIWAVEYQDIDIVDKFLEVERSALGKFDDYFFRFESEYNGKDEDFEKELYEEYVSWFETPESEQHGILEAMRDEGLLHSFYYPDTNLKPTIENLWKEMLRLKSSIKNIENDHFCIYIPPTRTDGPKLTHWFSDVLDKGVPKGLRLVTIDYTKQRKVKLSDSSTVKVIRPKLNMLEAIKNEMNKGCNSYDEVSPTERFSKQIDIVMECTLKKSTSLMNKEVKVLLALSKESNDASISVSALMIASQAYFAINENGKSEDYADQAITESEQLMNNGNSIGYPLWKSVVMLKAANLIGKKKRREAIKWYDKMAKKASENGDAYTSMEGYRMSGHLYYELGESNIALETTLLALVAGSFLDKELMRQSSFLIAANLAIYLCERNRGSHDLEILEDQLEDWLGEDWRDLVQTEEMDKSKVRRKASIFS